MVARSEGQSPGGTRKRAGLAIPFPPRQRSSRPIGGSRSWPGSARSIRTLRKDEPPLVPDTEAEETICSDVSAAAFQNMQSARDNVAELKDKLETHYQAKDTKVQGLEMAKEMMSETLDRHKLLIRALEEVNESQRPRID